MNTVVEFLSFWKSFTFVFFSHNRTQGHNPGPRGPASLPQLSVHNVICFHKPSDSEWEIQLEVANNLNFLHPNDFINPTPRLTATVHVCFCFTYLFSPWVLGWLVIALVRDLRAGEQGLWQPCLIRLSSSCYLGWKIEMIKFGVSFCQLEKQTLCFHNKCLLTKLLRVTHLVRPSWETLVTLVLVGQPSVIKVSLITPKCGKILWAHAGPGQYPSPHADFWMSMKKETDIYSLVV